MKTMDSFNFHNKKALIRVDFNVPLNDQMEVRDDTRIRAALPTIKKIIHDGGSAILMSHLGRPKNGPESKLSLRPVAHALSELLGQHVYFASDCIGPEAENSASQLNPGEVLLLENLRFHKREKEGTVSFAEALSKLGDCYVNDAFGTAHRAHASTTIVARFFPEDKMFGYLIEREVTQIDKVLKSGASPVTAIMGGAKVSTKIPIINNLIPKVDHLIIGGGMAYTFVKALGGRIGQSLVEDDFTDKALEILENCKHSGVSVHLPVDTIAASAFNNDAPFKSCPTDNIPDDMMGMDIGVKSRENFSSVIEASSTILWNGPMGVFEMSHFEEGTKVIGEAICRATLNGAFSLAGGGDSVAAVNKYGYKESISHVSTGGGALMEYMEGKTLPGIAAILGEVPA